MFQAFDLDAEIAELEARLTRATASDEPLLAEMASYVVGAGGKRVRPMAAVLAYRAAGGDVGDMDPVLDIAVGLELIHNATLVHDDINDGAHTRRGQLACHRRWGQANAIIAGDFLFTKGFQISGRFDRKVVDWTAEACRQLAEGEVLQARFLGNPVQTMDDYLLLVQRKTATFIEAGTKIGAHLARAPDDIVEDLGAFGLHLGIAFQMIDDVLDMTGDEARTGKTPGIDIKEGNATLPSILLLARADADAQLLREVLTSDERSDEDVARCLGLVRDSGALDEALEEARRQGELARGRLAGLPDGPHKQRLLDLVDLVIERDL